METPSYTIASPLCVTGDFRVYRGSLTENRTPILIKVPASPRPVPSVVQRLEHEYEIARALDPSRAVRPLHLEWRAGMVALLLEDSGGQFLADLLKSGPMAVARFLQIAIGISEALVEVHRNGFVHKDINPRNVIIDPGDG